MLGEDKEVQLENKSVGYRSRVPVMVSQSRTVQLACLLFGLVACSAPVAQPTAQPDQLPLTTSASATAPEVADRVTPSHTHAPVESTEEPAPATSTSTPSVLPTLDPSAPPCLEGIERRELVYPYERSSGDSRFTFSQEEFDEYMGLIGIESLCIPSEFGMPYLYVDWNDLGDPPVAIGRRVDIGFERQFHRSLSGEARIVYSTYDFEVGSEYEIFATEADLQLVRTGSSPDPIEVDGVSGFIRYHAGIPMGTASVYKTYIFPFDTYFIAFVHNLGSYEYDQVAGVIQEMEAGTHPDLMHPNVPLLDLLVSSIQFKAD